MIDEAVEDLLSDYHELNGSVITELSETPSPLEFMRFVKKGQPFVVRGAVLDWPAIQWTVESLENIMRDTAVHVATTPSGNADAAITNPRDSTTYFVKPMETEESFTSFIRYIRDQERRKENTRTNVKYGQAQDDNLRGEYIKLYEFVAKDIPWARIALDQEPDAINLWLGNSQSVTALHKDNYENIYCQLIGSKHFVLLSTVETVCVNEQQLPCANYAFDEISGWKLSKEDEIVPFPIWDPDKPNERRNRFSHLSRPLRFDLNAGDLLYLPALWYHKVSQSCSDQGICCAVNYWYDMDFEGTSYALCEFLRKLVSIKV